MRRRTGWRALSLAALISLAGCGSGSDAGGEASTRDTSSPSRSSSAGGTGTARPVQAKDLVFDLTKGTMAEPFRMAMTSTVGEETVVSITGVVDYSAAQPLLQVVLDMGPAGGERDVVRLVGNDLFVRAAPGQWIHVDTRRPPKELAATVDDLMNSSDPTSNFALFEQGGELQPVDRRAVDGTPVQGYRGDVDLQGALSTLPEEEADTMHDLTNEGIETATFVLSVDDADRLRRLELDFTGASTPVVHTVATYSDFGTPVQVMAPPRSTWQR